MNKKFPFWMFAAILSIGFTIYLGKHLLELSTDFNYSIETVQGDAKILEPLQLNSFVATSNTSFLESTVQLGKKLSTKNRYVDNRFSKVRMPQNYKHNYITILDSIINMPEIQKITGTFPFKNYSETVPFTLCFRDDDPNVRFDNAAFPFIKLMTPETLTVSNDPSYETHTDLLPNMGFSLQTTDAINVNGTNYFSPLALDYYTRGAGGEIQLDVSTLDYEITSGICYFDGNKVKSVFDYSVTNNNNHSILDLVGLNDKNALGLLVREENKILFLTFDLGSNSVVSRKLLFTMDPINMPKDSYYEIYTLGYNESSSTLSLYHSFNEHDKNTPNDTLFIYTMKDTNEPVSNMTLNSDLLMKINYENRGVDSQFYPCDLIYSDNKLYMLSSQGIYDEMELPPCIAVIKDGQLLYKGYINSDLSKDYLYNRSAVARYQNENEQDSWSSYYTYDRTYGRMTLTLKK